MIMLTIDRKRVDHASSTKQMIIDVFGSLFFAFFADHHDALPSYLLVLLGIWYKEIREREREREKEGEREREREREKEKEKEKKTKRNSTYLFQL